MQHSMSFVIFYKMFPACALLRRLTSVTMECDDLLSANTGAVSFDRSHGIRL
jgi:hypothetical protein